MTEVNKVSVRIPPFWPEDPLVWFAQIEDQFAIAGITVDTTKFYYITSNLEPQYARHVSDIIKKPPDDGKYEKLKTELIKRLSISQEAKLKQLLNDEVLGDRKPSEFLRHLQKLAGPTVPEDFMKTLWTGRLPTHIQTAVASQRKLSLTESAELADCIYDIVQSTPQVSSISNCDVPTNDMAKQLAELTKEVASLRTQLNNERTRHRRKSRDRCHNNNSHRSRSKSKSYDRSVCWYHQKFGTKANRCTTPCSYSSSSGNVSDSRK
ncbi:hypothetical protein K1T71_000998 [Dendrolimus kikuchii]|uniref:Uncharacterized protein n=1 Tax=Dendrolimus kikuchii TaxID=765133 RepID=A0ACC1DHV6_9NEOP|nr:hypothetical protein K1T71_000998 [Dendrolimus kikuchii]